MFKSFHSDESELSVLEGFKSICGAEYITKFSRMWTDFNQSVELSREFQGKVLDKETVDQFFAKQFSVAILTSGAWPISGITKDEMADFSVPYELGLMMDRFKTFYTGKYSGRRLTWLFQFSKCIL